MHANSLPELGAALIIIGIIGMLVRRNLLAIVLSAQISLLGIVLLLCTFMAQTPKGAGGSLMLLFTLIFCLQIMLACGLAVFTHRHRGTLKIDELRQLEG
jgi:NADH-quinone oxidoreductase subunit K